MVSRREMADPVNMQFGMKTRVGQVNHVLGVGPDPQGKGESRGHFPPHHKLRDSLQ